MPATALQESGMVTRRSTGTTLKPSRKARDAAEAELPDEEPQVRPRKKTKKRTPDENIENRPLTDSGEFQFTTLPANRTSKRAPNVIKLTANTDGIPRTNNSVAPARVVATQRQPACTPAPPQRKLTAEAAANLLKLRHPYMSPGRESHGRGKQSGTHVPPEVSQSQHDNRGPRPAQQAQTPAARSAARSTPRPAPDTPQAHALTAAATPRAQSFRPEVTTHRQSSVRPSPERSPSPVRNEVLRYAVSSVTHADAVGMVPRIPTGYHVTALGDVDDEWSDPGEPFEDYVSQPRARAAALAYGSQLTAAIPQLQDFNVEEQDEIDEDPDADLESRPEEDMYHDLDPQHTVDYEDEAPSQNTQHIVQRHVTDTADDRQDSPDQAEDIPEAQHRAVPTGKKVGVRDYEPPAQEILERAITIFKTHVTAENAYPDKLQEKTWAKAAWARAARELDVKLKPDGRAIELITRNSWGLRGEIKGFARHFVLGEYGFKQVLSTDADGVQRNVDLARQLLEKNTFKYKDPFARSDLFEGDIIQNIINRVFYKNPSDDGVRHDNVYRPFPVRGIALVLTAIQCAIQEWSTGVHQNVKFDELIYENEYKIHLQDLLGYEKQSEELKIVSAICLKIAQYGRDHAKAPLTQRGPSGALPSDELARAVAAYRLKLQNM